VNPLRAADEVGRSGKVRRAHALLELAELRDGLAHELMKEPCIR
jgi:hypothetical protein